MTTPNRVPSLWLLAAGLALGTCRPSETAVGCDDVRRVLVGARLVQPRLSGLGELEPCTSSQDLIPVTRCGTRLEAAQLGRLRELQTQLERQLSGQASSDQLQGAALIRLVLDADRPARLETAITLLREALAREDEPRRRAALLADLAGAHLLLAEQLQTPLEVAVALEAALEALELDPENPEARFNHQLARILLGIGQPEADTSDDPWLAELCQRLKPLAAESAGAPSCPSASDFRPLLDAWAEQPSATSWASLAESRSCWAQTKDDRFFAAVLDHAAAQPEATARAWQVYTAAEAALYRFEIESTARQLRALETLPTPAPVALAARRLEAIVLYQRSDYPRALELLGPLAEQASALGFFHLAGEAQRLMALIAHVRGEVAETERRLGLAAEAARKARYPPLDAAIASLRIEVLQKVGREGEAWRAVIEVLRAPAHARRPFLELSTLRMAAQLARDRGLTRVARALYDRGVELSENLAVVPQISSLRLRGELLLDLGRPELARADLALARKLLAEEPIAAPIAATLESDLLLLESRTKIEPAERRAALEALVASYRATEYNYRILVAELALAQLQREQGDIDAALATLGEALDELARQVGRVDRWSDAPALVSAARPLAEELVALELEHGSAPEVRETLATFFGLRSGAAHLRGSGALPPEHQRLTTFAMPGEVVLLLEAEGRLFLERLPIEREKLSELRERWLLQLRNRSEGARLHATAEPLSKVLLAPILAHVVPGHALTIVADDVLAGLPFHLLPTGIEGELLIDRVAVRYATDLRLRRESPPPAAMLAVGVSAAPEGLLPLRSALDEARAVAANFPAATLLIEPEIETLLHALAGAESVHLAGHFLANTRSPLDSALFLGGNGDSAQRLELRQLLAGSIEPPRLLYLSACDTGRGLPASAHGLASLAHAFASAGVDRTVLSLWPLDDRFGGKLAASFYHHLLAGEPAAEALRSAQLEHRGEHPSLWGSLVVVE